MPPAIRRVQGDLVRLAGVIAVLALGPVNVVSAQAAAAKPIPIRQLTPVVSTDSGVIANTYVIRVLADGRVLHNDALKHRLLLLDTTLKHYTILSDTAGQGAHKFGEGFGGLLPFVRGDSTAWVDDRSQALVVVDGSGNFGTVMAPPRAADLRYYAQAIWGAPGFDVLGRLYYRSALPSNLPPLIFDGINHPDTLAALPDSAPIIRVDFDRREIDTVAKMRIPKQVLKIRRNNSARGQYAIVNPLPVTDEWAYLPDGTVAIVRGEDYHVDWFAPDGTRKSTPKMAFDWRRVTDEEKQRMLDSTKRVLDAVWDRAAANFAARPPGSGGTFTRPHDEVVSANDVADYYPPIRAQQIRVDRDGNLWVVPTTSVSAKGGILYDVINHNGEIIERVQLPIGRNLHGFGPDGVIYMSVPASVGWTRLERARVIRP